MKFNAAVSSFTLLLSLLAAILLFSGCATSKKYSGFTFVRKYPKDTPFIFKNNITLKAKDAGNDEKTIMQSRLYNQLDDSARVRIKDVVFILHYIKNPPTFDTNAIRQSVANMITYLQNTGYYSPTVEYQFDTVKKKRSNQIRIITNYDVATGNRTTIDTVAYLFGQPELQEIATSTKRFSPLQEGVPVSKGGVIEETNRLVDLFRNYGYYKFTADEIRVTGDTTIAALTTITEDPFEQLRLLAEAARKRENPTIRLGFQLNTKPNDINLQKYIINDIYIMPDYIPGDNYADTSLKTNEFKNFTIRYHHNQFRNQLLKSNLALKEGDVFRQRDYYKTINNYYKLGVWENPTIDIIELPDTNLLNLVIKMIPMKRYGFEGNVELSYSANSNTSNLTTLSTGNLLGMSVNLSLTDRNLAKSAIRMTNSIRAGMEVNTSRSNSGGSFINSKELTYNNTLLFPKFIFPFKGLNKQNWITNQSFINTNLSLINRVDFFNQQIANTAYGFNFTKNQNRLWSLRLFNFDFRRLYNRSQRFDETLEEFPFLRYSFNTALVMGSSLSYSLARTGFTNSNVLNEWQVNVEESGLIWGFLKKGSRTSRTGNFFNKYLREFIKADVEFTRTINHPKSALVIRAFAGVGMPLSKSDTTLPFFKQYFGGGPNSMRGWPVRGIGVGGQPLAPYQTTEARFNDRTGDIQLEGNIEYRFDVAPLFSNAILFKMALFTDIGNIWNFKNTHPDGSPDITQFTFRNLYDQIGVSSGVGFRFDFSYFLLRFDMAVRIKRPDIDGNAGWQLPAISFDNIFGSDLENRIWRYQNFNVTIGIDYPF